VFLGNGFILNAVLFYYGIYLLNISIIP